jgi:septum formation protein
VSPKLILASTSRYRRELLSRLGLAFEVRAPGTDEAAIPGETPARMAERLAEAKARSIAPEAPATVSLLARSNGTLRVGQHADRSLETVVIGSDQVASLEGVLLRKPGTHAVALQQLDACQGKTVLFHTAVHVLDTASGRYWSHTDQTDVTFARLPRPALERYLEIEQPYDCVGSFKAEGLGVALFERIDSRDPTALIGLPLIWLAAALRSAGIDPLDRPPPAPRR